MSNLPANYKALELQTAFDAQVRACGLESIAAELGHPPMSHLEGTLAKLLTVDKAMEEIKNRVRKLADNSISVLILGKTGTGKELIAEALHGSRKPKAFVAINCGAIPADLLESELFGSKKGAFTGGLDRTGLIEQARDGTLFLDEIGDMPPLMQCKLLRVLQARRYRRVGDTEEMPIEFRLVSATNHMNLQTRENFRNDLYYRLAETTIVLPPLKERHLDDISLISAQLSKTPGIAEMAVIEARKRNLEGNVRELINIIKELNAIY